MKKYPNGNKEKGKFRKSFRKGMERKGFYIVLFTCAVLVGAVSMLNRRIRSDVSGFDEEAWREAIAESGIEEIYRPGEASESESRALTPVPAANTAGETAVRGDKDTETAAAEPDSEDAAAETAENAETAAAVTAAAATAEAAAAVAADSPPALSNPLVGGVIKEYSPDELVYSETMQDWRVHNGLDIAAAPGAQVKAAADGVVEQVYEDDMLGVVVVIGHSGRTKTLYANLQNPDFVQVGRKVRAGDIIGGVGSTAAAESADEPHLHFEVLIDQENADPDLLFRA